MKNEFWEIVRARTDGIQKDIEAIAKKHAGKPIDALLEDEEYRRLEFAQREILSLAYELAEKLFGLDD